jgi:hypothetical protein
VAEGATEPAGLRGRFRTQIRGEVKQAALRQLAAGGPAALSINAIARELDDALADALAEASPEGGRQPAAARLRDFAVAYRAWATTEPHRYRLLFTAPVPGYNPHAARLVAASRRAMKTLLDVLAELPAPPAPPAPLTRQLDAWVRSRGLDAPAPVALRAIQVWSRLHGLVLLEIEGNLAAMGLDPAMIFDIEVAALQRI